MNKKIKQISGGIRSQKENRAYFSKKSNFPVTLERKDSPMDNKIIQLVEKEYQDLQALMVPLFLQLFGRYLLSNKEWKRYYSYLFLLNAGTLFKQLITNNQSRLIEHLKKLKNQCQSNQSKRSIVLVLDKTSDGPRYGKKQRFATEQYTGSYGIIKTHGWIFLVAIMGDCDRRDILFLDACLYEKGKSESEWREGYKMLQKFGKVLDEEGISRDFVTVIGDNAYMNEESQELLNENGWIYVGKAGGRKKVMLNGHDLSLAEHSQRYWGRYKELSPCYHKKTKVIKYVRTCHKETGRVYFQGLFPRKYEHWAYPKRFLVTNWNSATAQWIFEKYNQRWGIEIYFRSLKQVCGWREYHPQTSGNRYMVHSLITILLYDFLNRIRRKIKRFGSCTLGIIKRMLIQETIKKDFLIEFPKDFFKMAYSEGIMN